MARYCGVFPTDTTRLCHIRHNNSTWHNFKTFQENQAKPLETVPYNIRQESQIIGIIVAIYNNNCLGTSVSIPKKDSCSLVYAATGPLSPGRRFFIYQDRPNSYLTREETVPRRETA
jgi:hypothetical protein